MNSLLLTYYKSTYKKTRTIFGSLKSILSKYYLDNWQDLNVRRYLFSSIRNNSFIQTINYREAGEKTGIKCAEFKKVYDTIVFKEKGIEVRKVHFKKHYSLIIKHLYLVKINPFEYCHKLDIPHQPVDVKDWCSDESFIAGINGGFYEKGGLPSGLLKNRDKITGSYNSKLSGLMLVKKGIPDFRWNYEVDNIDLNDMEYLIQSGPFIIEPNYKEGIRSNNKKLDRRTAIGKDDCGNIIWTIVPTKSLSLYELMKILMCYDIKVCLNLDGGASTGFYLSKPMNKIYTASLRKVPFVISLLRHYRK